MCPILGLQYACSPLITISDLEGLRQKSDTKAPFTLQESKELLEYLERDEDVAETQPEGNGLKTRSPPSTALIPSKASAKTTLVSWVLMNVGTSLVLLR